MQDNAEESSKEKLEEDGGGRQEDEERARETLEGQRDAPGGGWIKEEPVIDNQGNGDRTPSENIKGAEGGYPDRPATWMHPFFVIYSLSEGEEAARTLASVPRGRRRGRRIAKGNRRRERGRPAPVTEAGRWRAVRTPR